jgi:hypothetical protein
VLHEADLLLVEAGVHHATVELEELARCWPDTLDVSSRSAFVYNNLATLWSNFAAVGATRLLLAALVEHRSELRLAAEAIPDAAVTVLRLHAPLAIMEERIRRREPASPDGELDGARWWIEQLERTRPEDHLVESDNRPLGEIAREVLQLAGWLA